MHTTELYLSEFFLLRFCEGRFFFRLRFSNNNTAKKEKYFIYYSGIFFSHLFFSPSTFVRIFFSICCYIAFRNLFYVESIGKREHRTTQKKNKCAQPVCLQFDGVENVWCWSFSA